MSAWIPEVQPCPMEFREEALNILYQRVPASLRTHLVSDVLNEAHCGLIDLSGLWIATEPRSHLWRGTNRRRITGALLTQSLSGRAAAVWAPEVAPSIRRQATALALLQTALASLQVCGVRIAQAVLDESASRRGALDLIRGGMPRVTELLYLERETQPPLAPSRQAGENSRLEWQSFGTVNEQEFRNLLESTYISSLDMPELEGVRTLDDILQGHRASGRFVPELWQLGRLPGHPASGAVLLISEAPERDACEVVYLGLTPDVRGRGFGRQSMAHALELSRPRATRLELAVDTRNHPATRLYASSGFREYDRRAVHLAVFPEAEPRS